MSCITLKEIHRPPCIQPVPDRLNQEISEHFLYIYSQYLYKILNYGIRRKDSSGHNKKTFHSQYQYMKNKNIKNKCIIHSPVRHTGARVYNIGITTEEVQ